MICRIGGIGLGKSAMIHEIRSRLASGHHPAQGHDHKAYQDGDNRDHNQQFDEGESISTMEL
jgi:hypothetical protein